MNVLITGASKGIGFELVKLFADDRANNIIAISRDLDGLEELKSICYKEFNNSIHIYSIDFLSHNFEEEIAQVFDRHNFHFDVILNNAGYLINKSFIDSSFQDISNIYQTNVFAPMTIIKQVISQLIKGESCHVVNIGSMGGFQGSVKFPGLSIYSSSKAALANLTECLAEEYKDSNVKFNCLALGSVQTEMLNKAFPGFQAQVSPCEMALYIYNFAIQEPLYMNGKVLPVSSSTP